jgi:hypothetical protein
MLEKLSNLDSRWMYLALVLVLVIPIMKPIGMPISINKDLTQRFYDTLDALPPDSIVMYDIAYSASTDTELTPMLMAVTEQLVKKNVKVVVAGQWESGLFFTKEKLKAKFGGLGYKYGVDWINIGYKAGGTATWRVMAKDFWKGAMGVDIDGAGFDTLPLMQRVKALDEKTISAIVIYETGSPGMETWITYFPKIALCKASVASEIASSVRYIPSGQLKGMIPGMRGAAEYEKLVAKPAVATQLMDAQSLASLLVVALIVLGNVVFFSQKKKRASQ